jgi:hypothetical protein
MTRHVLTTPETFALQCKNYPDWLEFWVNNCGQNAEECSVQNCFHTELKGTVIYKLDEIDFLDSCFVVPICENCLSQSDSEIYELKPGVPLCPVLDTDTK